MSSEQPPDVREEWAGSVSYTHLDVYKRQPLTIENGPFIVVSGHDLHDLKLLLEQTKDKGINSYTHSEMLPAHGYPKLKAYPHLKVNFGTAWQSQQFEFHNIPAPILFTTNCLMPVRQSYSDRVFTTSIVSYPEMVHKMCIRDSLYTGRASACVGL